MKGYKVIIVLLCGILCILAEEQIKDAEQEQNSLFERSDKIILQKSQPYSKRSLREEPSFLSKLKSWIFPFGVNDGIQEPVPAASHHFTPKYLPTHNQEYKPNCNPCNSEPWTPIFTNYGKNTIVGFVQPSEIGNNDKEITRLELLNPPPLNNQYEPPLNTFPLKQYGLPQNEFQSQEYGPPKEIITQLPNYDHEYTAPNRISSQEYGPPRTPHLIKDPSLDNGQSLSNLPFREYGLPFNKETRQLHYVPSVNIKPPKPENGPPFTQYGPPTFNKLNMNHGPRHPPRSTYGFQKQTSNFINTNHLTTSLFHKQRTPVNKYVPPKFIPRQNGKYGAPNKQIPSYFLSSNMKPPPVNGYTTNYGVHYQFNKYGPPNAPSSDQVLPSPFPSDSYGAPVTGSNIDYGLSSQANKGEYSEPFTDLVSSNNANIEISQSIPLAVFDDILEVPNEPIAFPNLNHLPTLPIRNPENFYTNSEIPQHKLVANQNNKIIPQSNFVLQKQNSKQTEIYSANSNSYDVTKESTNSVNNKDVQIVPSIPVANFLSSVEYPINVIQSPIVEVAASEYSENRGTNEEKNYISEPNKLSENPIVVEAKDGDSHPSASAQNVTFHGSHLKRGNEKDLGILNSIENRNNLKATNPLSINQFLDNGSIRANDYNLKEITQKPSKFSLPSTDYSSWSPSLNTISTSIVPPPPAKSNWLSPTNGNDEQIIMTTVKPKQIQIIIPYTTIKKPINMDNIHTKEVLGRKVPSYSDSNIFEPTLSLYTQPPHTESVWLQHMDYTTDESKKVTDITYVQKPKTIINIKDLLKNEQDKTTVESLPFDIISLQKNIDGWTEQEYSRKMNREFIDYKKASTVSQLIPSKNIPDAYLTTNPYNFTVSATTSHYNNLFDHEPAGSNNKEARFKTHLESNFIFTDTTTEYNTNQEFDSTEYPEIKNSINTSYVKGTTKTIWGRKQSTSKKENVYVVTPEPQRRTRLTTPAIAFSESPKVGGYIEKQTNVTVLTRSSDNEVKPATKTDFNDSLRLIYSDWPHLINNLETTTKKSTTTRHPLFGQIDLSSYISATNSTIKTFTGHSKVITIVTPVSVSRRQSENENDTSISKTIESTNV